jgi:hypothetical protein
MELVELLNMASRGPTVTGVEDELARLCGFAAARIAELEVVAKRMETWREDVLHNAAGKTSEEVNEILDGIDWCFEATEAARKAEQ